MWVSALLLGLAGSLHCVGMCSPLVMSVTSWRKPFFVQRLMYNLGRILMYGLLGMLFGSVGNLFDFSGFQNGVTLVLGCLLLITGINGATHFRIPLLTPVVHSFTVFVKKSFAYFLNCKTKLAVTAMGMLNGLLPCGLTYLASTYCITLPSAGHGFVFMLLFGIGTLPVMLGLTSFLSAGMKRWDLRFGKLTTYLLVIMGVLLISRSWLVPVLPSSARSQEPHEVVICR